MQSDFIFKSEVTWDASGILICGASFRSKANLASGQQYQFYFYRLLGLPAYFIDVYNKGMFKNTITDARFSSDLDVSNGGTNQFMLVAQDDQFNVYINRNRQSRFFDYSKQRSEGILLFWRGSNPLLAVASSRIHGSGRWIDRVRPISQKDRTEVESLRP